MKNLKQGDDIKISSIAQIAQLNEHQFSIFVEDLKGWHRVQKKLESAKQIFTNFGLGDDFIKHDSSHIHWVYNDDGNADIKITVATEDGEEIASTDIKISQKDIR